MKFLIAVLFASFLVACGGGGGGATVPPGPTNSAPVANAGSEQNVAAGAVVVLDGGASVDANHDSLTYAWTLVTKPSGSTAILATPTSVKTTFTADAAGTYVASLTVNDGKISSNASTVNITATNGPGGPGVGFNYEALSWAVSSTDLISQANTEGAKGFFYSGGNLFSDGIRAIYIRDASQSSKYVYEALSWAVSSTDLISQANIEGAKGFFYTGGNQFSDGIKAIYVTDTSQSSKYVYETMLWETSSANLIAQANAEGAKGFFYTGGNQFSDGIKAIYVRDTSHSGRYIFKALPKAASSADLIAQANAEGANGFLYVGDSGFTDGIKSIYVTDTSQSDQYTLKAMPQVASSADLIAQASAEGANGFLYTGDSLMSDGIKSFYVKAPTGSKFGWWLLLVGAV